MEFIFLHVNKTGGVSINKALTGRISTSHNTAREMQKKFPEIWKRAFTFSFVRNPWSKEVADYEFHKRSSRSDTAKNGWSFEQYLRFYFDGGWEWYLPPDAFPPDGNVNWCWHRHQLDWIGIEPGVPAVDFVGRFEQLQQDFRKVCDRLQVPAKLPHTHKSGYTAVRERDPHAYRAYYTDETAEKVRRHYARDIDYFGYSY